MAVPKKKTSKGKRDQRKATWKRTAALQAQRALSLGKSVLTVSFRHRFLNERPALGLASRLFEENGSCNDIWGRVNHEC
jgi:large subunit ribosomal protein L32